MADDSQLIRQAQNGDSSALAQLLHNHYTFLTKYLIKITLQPELAADLAQDTMLKCVEKIGMFSGQSKFSSWMIAIATRLYFDHLRRSKHEQLWRDEQQSLRKMLWQSTAKDEQWSEALDALAKLPQNIRVPIILQYYYGYSGKEIAAMMGIPLGTVKSRIHNGLKNLRKELGAYEEETPNHPEK